MRGLVRSLIISGRISTTEAKAKAIRPLVERLTTLAKSNGVPERKKVYGLLGEPAGKKLFNEIGPKYTERAGGYTRIIKAQGKRADNASTVLIEFV